MKTKLTSVLYLGYTAMDRRFSNAMLPWLLREIRGTNIKDKLSVAVEDGYLKAYNDNFEPVIVHRLVDIIRACQVPGHPEELIYILVNEKEGLLNCYLYRAATDVEVTDLFTQMREPSPATGSPRGSNSSLNTSVTKNLGFQSQNSSEHLPWNTPSISLPRNCSLNLSNESQSQLVRTTSNASTLTSLCADLSPSESHFFEVLYIGKVRISQRKVPDSLIDDALHKFAQHEAEKAKINQLRRNSLLSSQGTSLSSNDSNENISDIKNKTENRTSQDLGTSTTPLEPDKQLAWRSAENITPRPESKVEGKSVITSKIDEEFDQFTKERVEKRNNNIKKPSQTPLEPTVLILNVPSKINLTTLNEDEEKQEDLNNILTNTASSITEFCQNNFLKDVSPNKEPEDNLRKDSNPFLVDLKIREEHEDQIKTNGNIKRVSFDKQLDETNNLEKIKEINVVQKKDKNTREDSPAPNLNFEEINRKPKMLMRSKTGLDSVEVKKNSMPENKPFLRDRSASIGTISMKTPIAQLIGEQNRTMLFQVARSELRLISPDRKQILLHRAFKDVASCVLGRVSKDHFGFVCRENANDAYACYVFKCESDAIALEVVNAIKQAFVAHAELLKKSREKPANLTCEHCPMLWYHRLCHDIDGMNEKKTHAFILRRIEQLAEDEQDQIITKYQGGTNHMYEVSEHNAFLMMLLRAHCEAKQQRHVHDTVENRSEFLNQYLGGSTIFMKAKRSLSSGFDHLLKRKASRDDVTAAGITIRKEPSSGISQETSPEPPAGVGANLTPDPMSRSKSLSPAIVTYDSGSEPPPSPTSVNQPVQTPPAITNEEDITESKPDTCSSSPMMDIFLKVSDSRSSEHNAESGALRDATWRQAVYQKVVQPADTQGEELSLSPMNLLGLQPPDPAPGKKTKEQLRQLWKMAIDQTILLVRMERENAKLRESEESSAVRRIKLEYVELGVVDAGVTLMWDSLLANRNHQISKVDHHMLRQAIIQGVPRMYRGSIWYFLAEQACLRSPPPDPKKFPNYNTPYHTLLSGLTKHQHAILIDLGRTFPQHSYFASALGPGQLSLYNILKAYSLLDPDVGYCQGLSFVAGTLLLHMEEADAFVLLRHLMFRRGLRKQYLPDMSALQVQLYQLSRLLRDHEPELHDKLEMLDISPALYAAPWMLTLFTSQFPLGFVVRVFDLLFLESLDIVFAVSLSLLSAHKDGLMMCESCEEAAEYLKHKLPDIDKGIYDKVMKKVHTLDISRQLADYAVEYAVLGEEMPRVSTLTTANIKLLEENNKMSAELDSAMDAITNYQTSQSRLENQVKVMEYQLAALSKYLITHHRQDLPAELKKITQTYTKKMSFGSKITSFSSKFTSSEDEEEKTVRVNTQMSAPNLFAKISKDDVLNATIRDKSKTPPESERKPAFIMKKSLSIHSGLIGNQRHSLKAVDEKTEEYKTFKQSLKDLTNTKKVYNTQEQIHRERMFEKQLKRDFDENLKRLDTKISSDELMDDIGMFKNKKCLSLSLNKKVDEQNIKNLNDSGFVTPLSPDHDKRDDISVISHPLSDCDVDIKFDGQSTKLKQVGPIIKQRTPSIDNVDYKHA